MAFREGQNKISPPRWSNLAFTFEELQRSAKRHFCFLVSIKTKSLSWVHVDPVHQALIDRILGLKEGGLNCRQIAAYLNDEGVTSWGGKRFYPELVFGVLRKARLKAERVADAVVDVRCEFV
jgi:hypothetical protein